MDVLLALEIRRGMPDSGPGLSLYQAFRGTSQMSPPPRPASPQGFRNTAIASARCRFRRANADKPLTLDISPKTWFSPPITMQYGHQQYNGLKSHGGAGFELACPLPPDTGSLGAFSRSDVWPPTPPTIQNGHDCQASAKNSEKIVAVSQLWWYTHRNMVNRGRVSLVIAIGRYVGSSGTAPSWFNREAIEQ